MPEVLQVESRTTRGTNNSRRLRKSGKLPAILYGHGEETVSLSVAVDAMEAVIRHGSHVVELDGAVKQSALIRELQWNTWGTEIVHVDFARVSADEVIEVTVPIELRGEAPDDRQIDTVERGLALTHNLGGYPGEMVSFVGIWGNRPG